jgi:hypothetical protein
MDKTLRKVLIVGGAVGFVGAELLVFILSNIADAAKKGSGQ